MPGPDQIALCSDALNRTAALWRTADTRRHDLALQASGLLMRSVGLSRQLHHDLQRLEAGMAGYAARCRQGRYVHGAGQDRQPGR